MSFQQTCTLYVKIYYGKSHTPNFGDFFGRSLILEFECKFQVLLLLSGLAIILKSLRRLHILLFLLAIATEINEAVVFGALVFLRLFFFLPP